MNSTRELRSLFIVCAVAVAAVAALAAQGCNGFGTTCSTTADCQAKNPGATCDPTLKVCFLYPGPYVQSIDPANQQVNVAAANGRVVVTFSELVADASVKDPAFTVYGQGFKTPGNYLLTVDAADASVATFKPYADGLALGTDYTVTLTSAIKDLSGNTLLPFTSGFTTKDGAFIAGNSIRYATQTGQFAAASNYYGQVVTAISYLLSYNSVDPSRSDFGMNAGVSAPGGSPTTATNPLQNTTGIQVNYPTAGIAADGTAFAAWTNSPTSGAITYDAEVALWDPSVQAWRYIQQLAGPDTKAQFPQVVGFNNGNGLAVWLQTLAGKQVVFGSFFLPDAGWLGAGTIQTDQTLGANPSGQPRQLTLAGDIPGDSLVAWQSEQATSDAGPPRILAAYFRPAGGSARRCFSRRRPRRHNSHRPRSASTGSERSSGKRRPGPRAMCLARRWTPPAPPPLARRCTWTPHLGLQSTGGRRGERQCRRGVAGGQPSRNQCRRVEHLHPGGRRRLVCAGHPGFGRDRLCVCTSHRRRPWRERHRRVAEGDGRRLCRESGPLHRRCGVARRLAGGGECGPGVPVPRGNRGGRTGSRLRAGPRNPGNSLYVEYIPFQ